MGWRLPKQAELCLGGFEQLEGAEQVGMPGFWSRPVLEQFFLGAITWVNVMVPKRSSKSQAGVERGWNGGGLDSPARGFRPSL